MHRYSLFSFLFSIICCYYCCCCHCCCYLCRCYRCCCYHCCYHKTKEKKTRSDGTRSKTPIYGPKAEKKKKERRKKKCTRDGGIQKTNLVIYSFFLLHLLLLLLLLILLLLLCGTLLFPSRSGDPLFPANKNTLFHNCVSNLRTDLQMNVRTDGQTKPLIEMRGRIESKAG